MKYYSRLLFFVFFTTCVVFSQEKVVKYTVSSGETVNQIAVKFKITPYDIYQLNPDARNGIKTNAVLLIPSTTSRETMVKAVNSTDKKVIGGVEHKVLPKETLYGIEKKYGISDEALKTTNPFLVVNGLQIGQTLIIPSKTGTIKGAKPATKEKYIYHDVLPKETKYAIARQYKTTIEDLEKRNPDIVTNLPIGYRLTISGTAPAKSKDPITYMEYQVKAKETLYSLSRTFRISQEELIALNPKLSEGLKEGMVLKVPAGYLVPTPIIRRTPTENTTEKPIESTAVTKVEEEITEADPKVVELSKKKGHIDRKKLVLLLPFNLSKIENDTANSAVEHLKKDKFLNMTLDFYSGALMAIDSAKVLKLPIDIEIYDSQETRNSSNVASYISHNKLQNANAIIGPFYQNNAETTANLLRPYKVPVISPLSKDKANSIENLYQAVPTNEVVRNTVFDYMRSKNGNIVAVVDRKKESVITYIKENQKGVVFAPLTESGRLDVASLKGLLLPNKMNYVVMETENTVMVKATIRALIETQKTCQIQLVILEPNNTLDTDEISFENLIKLKLMYPSVNRESDESQVFIFEKEYRSKNKINPNAYATRGFDVTFDTMMRLVQEKTYQETTDLMTTEQVDNKFQYYRKEGGGHGNKGVYILYYDSDLTLKVAN